MSGYKQDISKLDSPWRREALPPLEVLHTLGLSPGDDFADIGCGIGYFTIPAAEIISPSRKIYAVDPSREMLEELARRTAGKVDGRIELVQSDPEDFKIPSESVDFVLTANVFHEVDDKESFLRETRRILRPGGRVGLVEWRAAEAPYGPPLGHRIPEAETDRWFARAGYLPGRLADLGEYFYGRVYRQP
jgi:ubiquinone/menaquinone biosynthesis C-methylase UbiE